MHLLHPLIREIFLLIKETFPKECPTWTFHKERETFPKEYPCRDYAETWTFYKERGEQPKPLPIQFSRD